MGRVQQGPKCSHEAAASGYEKEAATLRQKAATHMKDGKTYQMGGNPKAPAGQLAKHCENLSKEYSGAATELDAMAKLHRDLAALVAK